MLILLGKENIENNVTNNSLKIRLLYRKYRERKPPFERKYQIRDISDKKPKKTFDFVMTYSF